MLDCRLSTYLIPMLHLNPFEIKKYQFIVDYIIEMITYNMHLFHLSNTRDYCNIDPELPSIDYLILMFSIINTELILHSNKFYESTLHIISNKIFRWFRNIHRFIFYCICNIASLIPWLIQNMFMSIVIKMKHFFLPTWCSIAISNDKPFILINHYP